MPAKDKQGVLRGKCNTCDECEEYTPPKTGARCDYCNHTPVDHVKIIKLGACKKCECQEYESDSKNSYSDCQYCECMASDHEGAEKLRRKLPTPVAQQPVAAQSRITVAGGRGGGGPMSLPTTLSSSPAADKCKNSGCLKPCYVENGKKHDFCSRTCASKYQAAVPQSSGIPSFASNVFHSLMTPVTPQQVNSPSPQSLPSQPTQSSSAGGGGGKLCGKCGLKPSNPGYKWCQSCFTDSKADS